MRTNQEGRSMMEALGVLAIVAILSIGALAWYLRAAKRNKMNTIREQISQVIANVKSIYATQGNFNGLTTENAIRLGIIPENMQIKDVAGNNGQLTKHIFNGEFLVEAQIDPVDNKPLFMVVLTGLPKDVAIDISTVDYGAEDGIVQMDLVDGSTPIGVSN